MHKSYDSSQNVKGIYICAGSAQQFLQSICLLTGKLLSSTIERMHFPRALVAGVVVLIMSVHGDDDDELTLLVEEEKKLKETATESAVRSFSERFSSDKLITESGNFWEIVEI